MANSSTVTVSLPPLALETVRITVIGDAPLIVHNWSKKAREEMLAKQMGIAVPKKREPKDPHQDFLGSLYVTETGSYGFPVVGIKAAAVTACTSVGGMTKVQARQAFHIDGEFIDIGGDEPTMREDMVRIGMGTADLRYRAEFRHWHSTFSVKFNKGVIGMADVLNLFQIAGFAVGIGEWRPERDGQFGRFHVANKSELVKLGIA